MSSRPAGNVRTDVVAVQRMPAIRTLPGEQQVRAGLLASKPPDGWQHRRVADRDRALLALLGDVVEHRSAAGHADVPLLQRGRAIVVVKLCVPLAADAEQAKVDQPHSACRDVIPVQRPPPQVAERCRAQPRQGAREPQHVLELLLVALLPPELVIAVLGPAATVDAGGLDVAERVGRDPHPAPGRRNHQRADPAECRRIGNRVTRRIPVDPAVTGPRTGDPGRARIAARQAGDRRNIVGRHSRG